MVGQVVAGRYRLVEPIGQGGVARVFRARDLRLDRWVAVKLLHGGSSDSDQSERFRREARAVASLDHPNVITLLDGGEREGCLFIVFEYVEGGTLKQLVRREAPLPVVRALELAIEIGRGVASAQSASLQQHCERDYDRDPTEQPLGRRGRPRAEPSGPE